MNGELAPGNSAGTLTVNEDLTLNGISTLTLEILATGAGNFDVLANDGGDTLTAWGTLDLVTDGYTAQLGDTFVVFDNWGAFGGSFSNITGTALGGGLSFDTSDLLTTGTLTVIPEPATLGIVAAFGAGILFIRRLFMI